MVQAERNLHNAIKGTTNTSVGKVYSVSLCMQVATTSKGTTVYSTYTVKSSVYCHSQTCPFPDK